MRLSIKFWKHKALARQPDKNFQAESFRIQKQMKFWTGLMAISAVAAAIFTFRYVWITADILRQAQNDSRQEFRPYVVVKEVKALIENKLIFDDAIEYHIRSSVEYVNPGKTPAMSFQAICDVNPDSSLPIDIEGNFGEDVYRPEKGSVLLGIQQFEFVKYFKLVLFTSEEKKTSRLFNI